MNLRRSLNSGVAALLGPLAWTRRPIVVVLPFGRAGPGQLCDPLVNDMPAKSPASAQPKRGNFAQLEKSVDRAGVALQVAGEFPDRHELGPGFGGLDGALLSSRAHVGGTSRILI